MAIETYQFLTELGIQKLAEAILSKTNLRIDERILSAIDNTSTNKQIPSAKLLYDTLSNLNTSINTSIIDIQSDIADNATQITENQTNITNLRQQLNNLIILSITTVTGNIATEVTTPSTTVLYFQRDNDTDTTWELYIYTTDHNWINIGNTEVDLSNYWQKTDTTAMKNALGIPDIYDEINNKLDSLVTDIQYYVDAINGREDNNGTNVTTPFRSIMAAINKIPKQLNGHTITVNIANGDYDEKVVIMGFCGGTINIIGATDRPNIGALLIDNSSVVTISNINIKQIVKTYDLADAGLITVTNSSYLYITDTVSIDGNGYGKRVSQIYVTVNSNIGTSQTSNIITEHPVVSDITVTENSNININNTVSSTGSVQLSASFGGTITILTDTSIRAADKVYKATGSGRIYTSSAMFGCTVLPVDINAGADDYRIATTKFVNTEIDTRRPYSDEVPKVNDVAAAGTSNKVSREDHVHPTDTTRQAVITGAATSITNNNLTASKALISDAAGKVAESIVTATEVGYLAGTTSAVQTQLNAKAALASPTFTGVPKAPTAAAGTNTTQIATTAFVNTTVTNNLPKAGTMSLPTASWVASGSNFTQTVAITGLTVDHKLDLQSTPAVVAQLTADGCGSLIPYNDAGVLTITAINAKPTVDLSVPYTMIKVA